MAELSDIDLALIRDEVGDTTPPTDDDLFVAYEELGHWLPVAIRVLKRRRASAVAGGKDVTSLSLPGAISIGLGKADPGALDAQIARLEREWALVTGAGFGESGSRFLRRTTAR